MCDLLSELQSEEEDVCTRGRLLKISGGFVLADFGCQAIGSRPKKLNLVSASSRLRLELDQDYGKCFSPLQTHLVVTVKGRLAFPEFEVSSVEESECVQVPHLTMCELLEDAKRWNGKAVILDGLYISGRQWDVLAADCEKRFEDDWATYPPVLGVRTPALIRGKVDYGIEGLHLGRQTERLTALLQDQDRGGGLRGSFVGVLQLRRSAPLTCDGGGGGATSDLFPGIFVLEAPVAGQLIEHDEIPSGLLKSIAEGIVCKDQRDRPIGEIEDEKGTSHYHGYLFSSH